MKRLILSSIMMIVSALSVQAQMKLELKMVPLDRLVLCEPAKLRIIWRNVSDHDIKIGTRIDPSDSRAVSVTVDGCLFQLPLHPHPDPLYIDDPKVSLGPNETQQGEIEIPELNLSPGRHTFQATADFSTFGEDYFHGKAESNPVTLTIDPPTGENALAYNYMIQNFKTLTKYLDVTDAQWEALVCRDFTNPGSEFAPKILSDFPNSVYAAWIVLPSMDFVDTFAPDSMLSMIKTNYWPAGNSVPDPNAPGGWKGIRGAAFARWQIEWTDRILRNHPDFPYAARLRLLSAIDQMALGNTKQGISVLKEIAKAQTEEGTWASQFLVIWKDKARKS